MKTGLLLLLLTLVVVLLANFGPLLSGWILTGVAPW